MGLHGGHLTVTHLYEASQPEVKPPSGAEIQWSLWGRMRRMNSESLLLMKTHAMAIVCNDHKGLSQ